jgi:large subunit ribosomal protein L24e
VRRACALLGFQPFWFLDSRCARQFRLKRNPRKICWTQVYRRLHKKGTLEEVQKKRARKALKVQRPIEGADLASIKAKRNQKPDVRQAAREAALRFVLEQARGVKKNFPSFIC